MRVLLRICLLPLLLSNHVSRAYCGQVAGEDATSITATAHAANITDSTFRSTASVTNPLGNATCISRTANYITHTLPQQCLRTDRVAANATGTGSNPTAQADSTPTYYSGTKVTTPPTHSETPSTSTATAPDSSSESTQDPSSTQSSSSSASEPYAESDSPLDNANFLSFEEWKKQNLAKSGQSPEDVGQGRNIEGIRERPINNALESYGDEGEIDLDFSGFGGDSSASRTKSRQSQASPSSVDVPVGELAPALRSKDAGKTCKERTNYASFDCAANVLKSNKECKSSSAVLVENKDSYMLNTCSASNKFFIVELCDDILIDTIVLANYEFFSSMFRHFRVSVSDRYPVKMEKWKELGTFEARNVRDVQAFLVERPQIWARYLRIEFLSHYGSEYYCPVSLLRVHGTTMLEDYRHQEEVARGDHAEEATLEVEVNATPALAQEQTTSTDESLKSTLTAIEGVEASHSAPIESSASSSTNIATWSLEIKAQLAPTSAVQNSTDLLLGPNTLPNEDATCARNSTSSFTSNATMIVPQEGNVAANPSSDLELQTTVKSVNAASNSSSEEQATPDNISALAGQSQDFANTTSSTKSSVSTNGTGTDASSSAAASTTSSNLSSSDASLVSSSTTAPASHVVVSSTESTRQSPPSSTTVPVPQPATQESFYKSVNKRLQQLESNSTLSLQYIEEQSRILRDAFSKVEKRQIAATTTFLTNLNSTVMAELQGFRQAYDQLWQSTVIELEGQREQYQREMLAMGSRLTLVADELVWQKRMGIVQSTLLLLCLGLVLFARQGNGYLEMPLMQQMVHRSQTALARAGWESPPVSPYASPNSRSPVSLFRRKLWRSHTEPVGSGEVTDATDSRPESKDGPALEVVLAPPTPPDEDDNHTTSISRPEVDIDDAGVLDEEEEDEDAAFEDVWESRSGPATPRGTREGGEFGEGVGWLDPGASGGVVEGSQSI